MVPNSSGNIAVGLSLPSESTQGTRSALVCTDPPAGVCQGFITEPRSPLEAGAPPAPCPTPPSPLPPSPMCFYAFCKQRMPNPTSQLALLHVFVFYACAPLASSAAAQRWRRRGESRGGGEGNGSRLLLSKPLFV